MTTWVEVIELVGSLASVASILLWTLDKRRRRQANESPRRMGPRSKLGPGSNAE